MRIRALFILAILALLAAGCGSLPGLRVLSGQDQAQAEQAVEVSALVMGDKTGNTDPALIAAADRIEAADTNIDIIEIRQDRTNDVFTVFLLLRPIDANATQLEVINVLRRVIELTWLGTSRESEGADIIRISILGPGVLPTLDHGPSFVGVVQFFAEISRDNMVGYLATRPNSLETFVDLIAQGQLVLQQPDQLTFYEGTPNHPMFLISALVEQGQQAGG